MDGCDIFDSDRWSECLGREGGNYMYGLGGSIAWSGSKQVSE